MKKTLVLILAAVLAILCGCTPKAPDYDADGWRAVIDSAILLPSSFSEETVRKCLSPEEIEFKKADAAQKHDKDYMEELRASYASLKESYDEKYGEDWELTWELREAVEKDADGIKKYLDYDNYFFETYGIDVSDIRAVTFAKITVRISGSKGSGEKDRTVQCFCAGGEWYSFYALSVGAGL